MGCNCGSSKNAKVVYVYTDGNGRQFSYNTEVEAKAAKIRDDNRGSVRSIPKP